MVVDIPSPTIRLFQRVIRPLGFLGTKQVISSHLGPSETDVPGQPAGRSDSHCVLEGEAPLTGGSRELAGRVDQAREEVDRRLGGGSAGGVPGKQFGGLGEDELVWAALPLGVVRYR